MNRTLGIVLVVIGLVGILWGGFTYTTREKVVDIGPIEATAETEKKVPVPPIAGAVLLVAGVWMIAAGKKD